MKFTDKVYDTLKWITLIALPAFAAGYGALASTWGLPYANEVVATVNIVTVFLGSLIGISTINYEKENEK